MAEQARWRITIRGEHIEARGWIDGSRNLTAFSDALRGLPLMVLASPIEWPADQDIPCSRCGWTMTRIEFDQGRAWLLCDECGWSQMS